MIRRLAGPNGGFVLAGKNMREVEARVGAIQTMAGLLWLAMLATVAGGLLLFRRLTPGPKAAKA